MTLQMKLVNSLVRVSDTNWNSETRMHRMEFWLTRILMIWRNSSSNSCSRVSHLGKSMIRVFSSSYSQARQSRLESHQLCNATISKSLPQREPQPQRLTPMPQPASPRRIPKRNSRACLNRSRPLALKIRIKTARMQSRSTKRSKRHKCSMT